MAALREALAALGDPEGTAGDTGGDMEDLPQYHRAVLGLRRARAVLQVGLGGGQGTPGGLGDTFRGVLGTLRDSFGGLRGSWEGHLGVWEGPGEAEGLIWGFGKVLGTLRDTFGGSGGSWGHLGRIRGDLAGVSGVPCGGPGVP